MNIIDTKINGGFWKKRKELNKNTSLFAVMKSFEDTGRVKACLLYTSPSPRDDQ